jgi:hypothetical protein
MGTNRDITRLPGHVVFVLEVNVPAPDSYRQLSTQPGRTELFCLKVRKAKIRLAELDGYQPISTTTVTSYIN